MDALSFTIAAKLEAAGFTEAATLVRNLGASGEAAGKQLKGAGDAGANLGSKVGAGAKDAADKLAGLSRQAEGFFETLKGGLLGGFSAGVGIGAAETALEGLVAIGEKVKEVFVEGVRANAELEQQTNSLAATLRSVEPEKYLSFESAKNGAAEAIQAIRQQAINLGQDSHAIIEAYGANLSALAEAGVDGVGRQVQLVTALMAAAASKGISGVQALKDVIDILNGRAGNIVLAKELGLENSALKEAATNGTTYALIMGKLVGYNEGLGEQADSFKGLSTSIGETGKQLAQLATEDAFKGIESGLREFKAALADPSLRTDAAALGRAAGGIAAEIIHLGAVAVEQRDKLAEFFKLAYRAFNGPAALIAGGIRDAGDALNEPLDEAIRLGDERIEQNRRLIDQADTEEKRALIRNNMARQLASIEGQIGASRVPTLTGPADTERTEQLQRQQFLLQDQNNFLDAQAGKHAVVASIVEHEKQLTAEQAATLREINAALDQRAQKGASLESQARNLADATEEQIRKASAETGIADTVIRRLRTRTDIEGENLKLTAAQALKLAEQVVLINQARDAEQKAADARRKEAQSALDATVKSNADDRTALGKAQEVAARGDRSTPAADAAYLEALRDVDRIQTRIRLGVELERAARVALFPTLKAERDALQGAIDSLPKTDRTEAQDQQKLDLTRAQRDVEATSNLGDVPIVGELLKQLLGGPLPTASAPPAQGALPAAPAAPPPAAGNGDTGPLSDANFQETADSRIPGLDNAATAAEGLKTAFSDGLAPVAESLNTAANNVPGQVAPVTAAVGNLGSAYGAAFNDLAGAVEGQMGAVEDLARAAANLRRDVAQLTVRVNQLANA